MTISVYMNGNKLFDRAGSVGDAEELDKLIREVAHNHGVTPEWIANNAVPLFLEHRRSVSKSCGEGGMLMLVWMLLSKPTGHPDHPGLYRDYVEAWDLYFYIDRRRVSKRISILGEIIPKGASPLTHGLN